MAGKEDGEDLMTRRAFDLFLFLLTSLAYGVGFLWSLLKFLAPLPPSGRLAQLEVGAVSEFAEKGEPKQIEFNNRLIFVLRGSQGEILALDAKCTHLGCNVAWKEGAKGFHCHCHSGVFDRDGKAVRKPPVESLRRQKWSEIDGRVVLIDDTESAS